MTRVAQLRFEKTKQGGTSSLGSQATQLTWWCWTSGLTVELLRAGVHLEPLRSGPNSIASYLPIRRPLTHSHAADREARTCR
jgi:hypothetical protein